MPKKKEGKRFPPMQLQLRAQVIIDAGTKKTYKDMVAMLIKEVDKLGFNVTVAIETPLKD